VAVNRNLGRPLTKGLVDNWRTWDRACERGCCGSQVSACYPSLYGRIARKASTCSDPKSGRRDDCIQAGVYVVMREKIARNDDEL
jgi:hypothetical protein